MAVALRLYCTCELPGALAKTKALILHFYWEVGTTFFFFFPKSPSLVHFVFFFFFFLAAACNMWDLSFPARDRTCAPLQWKYRVLTTGSPLWLSLVLEGFHATDYHSEKRSIGGVWRRISRQRNVLTTLSRRESNHRYLEGKICKTLLNKVRKGESDVPSGKTKFKKGNK